MAKKNDDFLDNDYKICKAMIVVKNFEEAKKYLEKFRSPIANLLKILIESASLSKDDRDYILEIESIKKSNTINKFLPILKLINTASKAKSPDFRAFFVHFVLFITERCKLS